MVYFFMVNLLRLSSSWNAAHQCELVRGDTPPGAFAMAVTIVDRDGRNAADQCNLVRGDTPPGAFAMAVTIVTEAVGTPPTNAN